MIAPQDARFLPGDLPARRSACQAPRMLKRGDRAPAFELPDQEGRLVRLTELLAEGSLLVYFYPADFTPG